MALNDGELKDLVTGKYIWLKNTVTGGIIKTQWSKEGLLLIMNVDPRIAQPSEFGALHEHAYLGDPNSAYSIADGKLVTNFGNRDYRYTVYKLDGDAEAKEDSKPDEKAKLNYVFARSNEFGYANYEVIDAPVFLGTEVKGATVPAEEPPTSGTPSAQ